MTTEWEVDTDTCNTYMVCDGPETVVCRGIKTEHVARLIAGAPELLAALVAIVGRVQPDTERADPAMNAAMRMARKIVAKVA